MEKAKLLAKVSIFWIGITLFQFFPVPQTQAAVTPPAFELSPSSGTYYLSCNTVNVNMRIYTNNTDTDSSNIIVNYDSTQATITDTDAGTPGIQISTGTAYSNHASYTVDESGDRILLTGFNISSPYNSGASYGLFGSFSFTPIQAGTANFDIDFTPASTTDSNIAETVTSNDLLNDVQNASFTFIADSIDPYLDTYSPAQSATGVAISQNVTFRIHDDECGVDLSTLSVTVKGVTYTQSGPNTFSSSGSAGNYLITVNPAANFAYGETVNVSVDADDIYGNSMAITNYSFTTIADTTPPAVSNKNPAASAVDVSIGSNVSFNITDAVSGVKLSSVSVVVNGVTYTQSGPNTFGYSGSTSNYLITVNPASNFAYADVISVSIDADDLNNNTMSTVSYSFTVESDTLAPTISNRSPASGATDVSVATNVGFTIADAKSGVDLSTVSVVVDGVTYTQSGPNTFGYSGSTSSYNITINPASDFTRGDTINVSIDGSDLEGNAMTTDTYSFDVVANAVPVITMIPDKTVTAGNLLVFIVQATDADGDNIDIALDAPALPSGATLSNVSATQWIFTWTPSESDVGVYPSVDFVASDDGGGSSTYVETIQITVETSGVGNAAPSITAMNDQTVYQGSILNLIIHATDADGDTITLGADTAESASLIFTNISNGIANLNIDTSALSVGTHVITVSADDPNGGSSEITFSVTVNALSTPSTGNTPTIQLLSDQTMVQGSVIKVTLSAADVDEDTLTLTATTTNLSALTLTNVSNGLGTLTIDTAKLSIGANVITVSATDDELPTHTVQTNFTVTVSAMETATCTSTPTTTVIYGGSNPSSFDPFRYIPHLTPPPAEATYTAAAEITSTLSSTSATTAVSIEITAAPETAPSEPIIIPPSSDSEVCTPEITEKEVVRYMTRSVRNPGEDIDPSMIYFHPDASAKNSFLEPVVMVIQADANHTLDSFTMRINGKDVPYQLNSNEQGDLRYYSLIHTPKNPYTPDSKQIVIVSFLEKKAADTEIYRSYTASFNVQSLPPADQLYGAPEAPEKQYTPADLGLLVKNLVVDMDDYGLLFVTGEAENANEVDAIWHGRDETLKVVKHVKGNKFKIRAPLHFENGSYFVDVIGRHTSGIETDPTRITFTVKNDFIKYDVVPGRNAFYIKAFNWWNSLFLIPVFTTLWYWRKSRIKKKSSTTYKKRTS